MNALLRRFLRIAEGEIDFRRRGFRGGTPESVRNVEAIGAAFLHGYHQALDAGSTEALVEQLELVAAERRGFSYEGAAMALYLLDRLVPGRRDCFAAFLADGGSEHLYMAYIGAGWAHARLPFGLRRAMTRLDLLLRWLVLDGYGFHQGFFHWRSAVEGQQRVPRRLESYARRAFDQGLGRSLWFVDGHDVDRIAATVSRFAPTRHSDLWAGVGLAATYAGGAEPAAMWRLREHAGTHRGWLAQGSAFAAKARMRAGNLVPHNDVTCRALCGVDAITAAALVDAACCELPPDQPAEPAYEVWRRRTRERLEVLDATSERAASVVTTNPSAPGAAHDAQVALG